jgi:hypothetical protein
MMAAAIAFFVYASGVSWVMMHYKAGVLWVTICFIPLWLSIALGLWRIWLR